MQNAFETPPFTLVRERSKGMNGECVRFADNITGKTIF